MKPEFTLDWPHGWTTRDGRAVRIICTDKKDTAYPIVALITGRDGNEMVQSCALNGCCQYVERDLINRPEKRTFTGWVNIYGDGHKGGIHLSKQQADRSAAYHASIAWERIACIQITQEYEVGEGLDDAK